MIKLDKSYSDYTDETDGNYPAGKAVNASSNESYDGTPWLDTMMNDMHGARQAIYKAAYGSVDGLSGVPDNVEQSDTLKAIRKLIDDPDKAHADLRGSEAHGATAEASSGQIVTRDEFGRAKVAAPLEEDDIARQAEVDAAEARAKNLANATGVLAVAKGGTGETTLKDSANVLLNGLDPEASVPSDGDYYISQSVNGGTTTTAYHRRPVSALWEYIKGKISSVLGLTSTSYGGKAATAGTADTAKACTGNSETATKATQATQDGTGNNIVNTYATKNELKAYAKLSFTSLWTGRSTVSETTLTLSEPYTNFKIIVVEGCMYNDPDVQRMYAYIPSAQCSLQPPGEKEMFLMCGSTDGTSRRIRFYFPNTISLYKMYSDGSDYHKPIITNIWGVN